MGSILQKNVKPCFLVILLFLQLMVYLSVFFNIQIVRQSLGFCYFTFIPGFIILKLLKLGAFGGVETLIFSAGLSIAFIMIAGLLINELSLLFNFLQPLSLIPLLITINSFTLIGGVLLFLRDRNIDSLCIESFRFSPSLLLLVGLPILSILGAMWVNVHGNNVILLFMIMTTSLLFVIGILSEKLLPLRLYPLAILMIAITVLYHSSLISNFIVPFGSDVSIEYYVFKTTEENMRWISTPPISSDYSYGRIHAMLSVTILPTLYSLFLNINSSWMFKLLFPLIFSFVPVGLYQVWQTYISKKQAFMAAFLLMAQYTFYTEMLGLNRQMIAELFFVELLLVITNKKMKPLGKMMLFMIFSFALVTSHYGLAEIFLFFIFFALVFGIIMKRSRKNVTINVVLFFFVIMFAWYIFTANSATFQSLLDFGDYVYRQLGDFFDPSSRGQTVLIGLGMAESPSIWNTISRFFAYLTQAFIIFGFIGLLTKRKLFYFEDDFFIFSSIAIIFLSILILVPGLAQTMNMTRFYHLLLFFLAPLCAVGADFAGFLIFKKKNEIFTFLLLISILVPYFLFQTGFVYEVTGSDSWSIPLSKYRMDAFRLYCHYAYTDEYSVSGVKWLSRNIYIKNTTLYADSRSPANVLTIYGMIYVGYINMLSNTTTIAFNGVAYLNTLNVIKGIIPYGRLSLNTSELIFLFNDLNFVYANGGSEIYAHPP